MRRSLRRRTPLRHRRVQQPTLKVRRSLLKGARLVAGVEEVDAGDEEGEGAEVVLLQMRLEAASCPGKYAPNNH